MNTNKVGLIPLLATILLMLFAIVLGTTIISIGKSYFDKQIQKGDSAGAAAEDPLKEAQLKYTNGQITRYEYLEMEREILQQEGATAGKVQ